MKKIYSGILFLSLSTLSLAQWTPTSMKGEKLRNIDLTSNYYSLDLATITKQLSNANISGKNNKPVIITLPTLEGKLEKFAVYSSPVVEQNMAEKYQLGSYSGVGIDDPTKYVRFSISPYDLQSMMYTNGKYEFIEPINKERNIYGVLSKTNKESGANAFTCKTTESEVRKNELKNLAKTIDFSHDVTNYTKANDKKFRTYRLAISVTGEYTQYFGGVPQAVAAINATMTRVNGVFEKDFAINLIVQDFPQLIYTNSTTDPYSDASKGTDGAWNLELQKNLTATIGNDAYDIGHLFGASGGGGSAGDVGNVCRNPTSTTDDTAKGSAYTSPGSGGPEGDTFDIDYVAHEMGHQFGADHTFSHALHSSPNNTAHLEPGSGSTIMGYAGITNANVQKNSDPYFNVRSIEQVQIYANSKSCDINTPITNTPPVIESLSTRTIPKGTAFALTANVTDAEQNPLTYTWEQYDIATSPITSTIGNNTTGPTFRSLPPTTSPTRYFPKLSSVLSNQLVSTANWEALPNISRTLNFRITVRDNHPNVTQQQTQIGAQQIIVGENGPFIITTNKVYNNLPSSIKWDVVGTNTSPYNVANVKIDYTTDNGTTWITLIESTPNDGEEVINFEKFSDNSQITVRVSAIDNVFYTIGKVSIYNANNCTSDAPTGLATSSISQTSAKLTWTIAIGANYSLRYKKNTETDWTEINGITGDSYELNGLILNTNYDIALANVCSGSVGAFANLSFTTKGLEYCTADAASTDYEKISKVTFADINKSSTSTAGYENFTSVISNVEKTKTYNFSASFSGTSFIGDQVYVWIDLNQDGDFSDAEELVMTSNKSKSPWTGSITIPSTALEGKTRMRVRLNDTSEGSNTTPCGTSDYGQVEDYTLNITELLSTSDISNKNIMKAYPNPVKDIYNIEANSRIKNVNIIDNSGKQVVSKKVGADKVQLNLGKLNTGIYIVITEMEDGTSQTTKVIKQ